MDQPEEMSSERKQQIINSSALETKVKKKKAA
jgi:hypothetical protein